VTNSGAAALFGSDYTNQVDTRAAGIEWRRSPRSAFTWRLAYESERPLLVKATSLSRRFAPTLSAWELTGVRGDVRGTGGWVPTDASASRGLWSLSASAGSHHGRITVPFGPLADPFPGAPLPTRTVRPLAGRVQGLLQVTKPLGGDRALFLQSYVGLAGGRDLPPQGLVFAGGPWSAPGYDYLTFAARGLASQRVELRLPAPGPSIPLGRFGKSPPRLTLAPFVQALAVSSGLPDRPMVAGVYPSAGVGMLFFYDLLRADVARGLRDGHWRFSIDIDRSFWGML
jgi:hypothetical protein